MDIGMVMVVEHRTNWYSSIYRRKLFIDPWPRVVKGVKLRKEVCEAFGSKNSLHWFPLLQVFRKERQAFIEVD